MSIERSPRNVTAAGGADTPAFGDLRQRLRAWAHECGFSQIGIAGIDLASAEPGLAAWLRAGFHGEMDYMARHGLKRARPAELVPGTVSVICARMDYLPHSAAAAARCAPAGDEGDRARWAGHELERLARPAEAAVSLYARGRDYHRVLRSRLQRLADRLAAAVGPFGHRVFTDLALAPDEPPGAASGHCGTCTACLRACPTGAIVAPWRLDARRCISYLTIELHGPIPRALRPLVGNRIYGCDDCQLVCPWNKYARTSPLPDFDVREGFGAGGTLRSLWAWDEAEFLRRTEGSAIRRIGWPRWRRNLAVAIGNALRAAATTADERELLRQALASARDAACELVREHIDWALEPQPDRPAGPGQRFA